MALKQNIQKSLPKPCFYISSKALLNKPNENFMQVSVRDNNVDQALRVLKKKLQGEGVFREMKLKQHFEKPSEKKARRQAEAIRRARKVARKKLERDGTL
jgi:small subunit ribosomal protein S21|tara:strand:- start:1520 stop:1819 length:300 start_codon:yes stop_codon:yes gene_type:complete